jgi:hypothetical protein
MKSKTTAVAILFLAGCLIALRTKTPPGNPERQIRELE